ncbi:MAG TPA: hypothetical protein VHO70_05630, partial [Chitinispirillaceae bacterium]|nr:hypothetical protein [Chitinispirillaceae bacterium]
FLYIYQVNAHPGTGQTAPAVAVTIIFTSKMSLHHCNGPISSPGLHMRQVDASEARGETGAAPAVMIIQDKKNRYTSPAWSEAAFLCDSCAVCQIRILFLVASLRPYFLIHIFNGGSPMFRVFLLLAFSYLNFQELLTFSPVAAAAAVA